MRRQLNYKAKNTDFFDGMYFENNNIETNLNNGLDFVNIGNLASSHELFIPVEENKCFSITGKTTSLQSLNLIKCGKVDKVFLKWDLLIESSTKLKLAFRIRKQNSKGIFEVIDSTRVTGTNGKNFGQTIINILNEDKFYMQLRNIDVENPILNVIIKQARLIIEE